MEVELDVPASPREGWREWFADWKEFLVDWMQCQEDHLFKDEPFTPTDWERHRSWRRHCPEPRIFARVFRMLSIVELWLVAVSTFVMLYAHFLQPKGWPQAVSKEYMIIFQLTSFALSLLMVFRTQTAHARWWEARTAVGRWLNVVRNTQRMLMSWVPPSEAHLVGEFARWNAVLTPAACAYLCRRQSYWEVCEDLLQPSELAWLRSCDNPPVKVLAIMSGLVKRTSLSQIERTAVEGELNAFDVALGACERITRQAIPMAYTRHTSRFIIVYLTFLPFALWPYVQWLLVPIIMVLGFLLVGIENIGVQIENPVRVLPMRRFCIGNRTAALSMVRHHGDVQHAIEAGLLAAAAAAAAAESPMAGMDGKGQAAANGAQVGVTLPAPPAPIMTRG
ncbi:UPF0187 chloroplastic [Chlorella sorokiniana]|uniref:UPF0187 chloroplastic n=1 Tax=Chlorella sorokiniana TaxID=3076 RepID=A0A2P6TM76_CHLSO|nr:UPF0187 chloroplastic [Chlorella sorokiniana]|eukprot:PRW45440.1 UPF0187 chloroplastic [Chlorella sorokiniana]